MDMQKLTIASALAVLAALFCETAVAQARSEVDLTSPPVTLKEAVQAAVLKSPEVQARWHAFRESSEEIGVARGEFFPKVDLSAAIGRIKTEQKRIGVDGSYHGSENTVSLRQMIFDGFSAYNEVKRLGKARLVRYFELMEASENAALEAGRAYLDVVRYREQVKLAEDNYIQHYAAHEQLKRRASSGVGRQVDVDQAASRLALADVNVTTAYANLHDVTARYLRIVGANPHREMGLPERVAQAFPEQEDAALAIALRQNPALRASIENIEAAQYDIEVRRAAFMPRLDFIARRDHYGDYEDNGHRDESRVELRLNYNLFNGGSDLARSRQYRERKNIALDLREKACRDTRQTLAIAFNDTVRLTDQLAYLATQVELVAKTRTAYRDQFNIGQRTLLDLLNTQNEYFDARRAQLNADADLSLAYLRSYAGMGRLLEVLELKHVELEDDAPDNDDFAAIDLEQLCPPLAPGDATPNREALLRKAREMSENTGFIGTRTQPTMVTPRNDAPSNPGSPGKK
jgi:adhesin transport system outer membrane protein